MYTLYTYSRRQSFIFPRVLSIEDRTNNVLSTIRLPSHFPLMSCLLWLAARLLILFKRGKTTIIIELWVLTAAVYQKLGFTENVSSVFQAEYWVSDTHYYSEVENERKFVDIAQRFTLIESLSIFLKVTSDCQFLLVDRPELLGRVISIFRFAETIAMKKVTS